MFSQISHPNINDRWMSIIRKFLLLALSLSQSHFLGTTTTCTCNAFVVQKGECVGLRQRRTVCVDNWQWERKDKDVREGSHSSVFVSSSPSMRMYRYVVQTPPPSQHHYSHTNKKEDQSIRLRSSALSSVRRSHSVLADCDTLPSFPTAHGMLSPETVMRIEQQNAHGNAVGGDRSEAISMFLERYHRHGPMSCLSMLSDPDILPHLTAAMRDIC